MRMCPFVKQGAEPLPQQSQLPAPSKWVPAGLSALRCHQRWALARDRGLGWGLFPAPSTLPREGLLMGFVRR